MRSAPAASISVRSKPSATPQQSGQARLQCREQTLVEGGIGQAGSRRRSAISRSKRRALLARRGELMKAVGELDAVAVELEALRGARVVGIEPGERRLARGIAVHEGQAAVAEPGPDDGAHQELEQLVAVGCRALEARPAGAAPRAARAAP